jgi:hypothetical protein
MQNVFVDANSKSYNKIRKSSEEKTHYKIEQRNTKYIESTKPFEFITTTKQNTLKIKTKFNIIKGPHLMLPYIV